MGGGAPTATAALRIQRGSEGHGCTILLDVVRPRVWPRIRPRQPVEFYLHVEKHGVVPGRMLCLDVARQTGALDLPIRLLAEPGLTKPVACLTSWRAPEIERFLPDRPAQPSLSQGGP